MNFTASSFERMMKQKPRPQAPGPAKPPRGSACSGCPYWRGLLCLLLSETFSQAGRREVTLWPAN